MIHVIDPKFIGTRLSLVLLLYADSDSCTVDCDLQGFTPKAGSFLPFGGGSRLCPGNDLAKLEIAIFLHYFLLGYKCVILLCSLSLSLV